jgi:hypothetical protein
MEIVTKVRGIIGFDGGEYKRGKDGRSKETDEEQS